MQTQTGPRRSSAGAMLVSGTGAMAVLSATGTPTADTVQTLVNAGLPQAAAGPLLHLAPIAATAILILAMRAVGPKVGPMTRLFVYAGGGGLIGFFTAFCLDLFAAIPPVIASLAGPMREANSIDIAARATVAFSIAMALMTASVAAFGTPAVRAMQITDADPECASVAGQDRSQNALSSIGLFGQGLFVAALAVANQAEVQTPALQTGAAIAAILGAALFGWSSLALWRSFDEMLRRVVMEAYAWTGLLASVACLAWAVLESLHIVAPMTGYGAMVTLVALQTFVTMIVSGAFTLPAAASVARSTP